MEHPQYYYLRLVLIKLQLFLASPIPPNIPLEAASTAAASEGAELEAVVVIDDVEAGLAFAPVPVPVTRDEPLQRGRIRDQNIFFGCMSRD